MSKEAAPIVVGGIYRRKVHGHWIEGTMVGTRQTSNGLRGTLQWGGLAADEVMVGQFPLDDCELVGVPARSDVIQSLLETVAAQEKRIEALEAKMEQVGELREMLETLKSKKPRSRRSS